MSLRRSSAVIDGELEAQQLAYQCFVRNIGLTQFRRMHERERECHGDIYASLDSQSLAKALRFIGVSRKAPDLIAHANTLEASIEKAPISA